MHAITDAILGACRLGDIGQIFSDKNKKFKNIRSTLLLKQVIKKIKKNRNKKIYIISKLCEINKDQINIKGKTTEKLGLIGQEKAIASEVIVSVIKHD